MGEKTKNRVIRVPDTLWDAAKATAAANDTTISDVIRDALKAYVEEPRPVTKNERGRKLEG